MNEGGGAVLGMETALDHWTICWIGVSDDCISSYNMISGAFIVCNMHIWVEATSSFEYSITFTYRAITTATRRWRWRLIYLSVLFCRTHWIKAHLTCIYIPSHTYFITIITSSICQSAILWRTIISTKLQTCNP